MRVLLYNDIYQHIGGAETFVKAVSGGLQERGIATHVLAFHQEPPVFDTQWRRISAFVRSRKNESHIMKAFNDVIREFKPDVIHCNNNRYHFQSIFSAAQKARVPIVSSIHDYDFLPGKGVLLRSPQAYVKRLRIASVMRASSFVLAPSRNLFRRMQATGSCEVVHLPYFADPRQWPFRFPPSKRSDRLLFIGRLIREKGVFVLLKAFSLLQQRRKELQLTFVGEGRDRKALERQVELLDIPGRVTFAGQLERSEVLRMLHQSRMLLMPSVYQELFGIAGLEAQAAGVPVIASDTGDISEWCQNQKTGMLVTPNNSLELSRKIEFLLDHPALEEKLVKNARDFILEKHHPDKIFPTLIDSYEKAIFFNSLKRKENRNKF